jgi:hypothetical protein
VQLPLLQLPLLQLLLLPLLQRAYASGCWCCVLLRVLLLLCLLPWLPLLLLRGRPAAWHPQGLL